MINIPKLKIGDRYWCKKTGIICQVYALSDKGYYGFYYRNNDLSIDETKYFCPNNDDIKADWNDFFKLL